MCESLKLVIASPDAGRNPSRYHPPTQRRRPVRQMPNPIGECPTISAHQGVWAWAYDHRRQVHRTYLRIFTEANQIPTSANCTITGGQRGCLDQAKTNSPSNPMKN